MNKTQKIIDLLADNNGVFCFKIGFSLNEVCRARLGDILSVRSEIIEDESEIDGVDKNGNKVIIWVEYETKFERLCNHTIEEVSQIADEME